MNANGSSATIGVQKGSAGPQFTSVSCNTVLTLSSRLDTYSQVPCSTPSTSNTPTNSPTSTATFTSSPVPIDCSPFISFAPPVYYPVGSPRSVAVGDFNGDGYLDLATGNNYANNIAVLLGNG